MISADQPEQESAIRGGRELNLARAMDSQMERIRRIGKSLFQVANCILTFHDVEQPARDLLRSSGDEEAAFCSEFGISPDAVVVQDTHADARLRLHPAVMGSPYIRFYAAYPVHHGDGRLAGSIGLIDYAPRAFGDDQLDLLADLAALAEREIHLRSIRAAQLDLQNKNNHLRRKSLIDPLLGTWNRGAIMRILSIEAARCGKFGLPLSLIVVDLDYFKRINDTYGHQAGDAVLTKVAARLRGCIRPQEALGRYGGEEFLVVLPDAAGEVAMAIAERMRQAVASQQETVNGAELRLTISAGVASTDQFPQASAEELISRADGALYAAKDAGRNCVVQAVPGLR